MKPVLHLGKMTIQELADWFGVKKKTFSDRKQRYLEKLKAFADFTPVYGGVEITRIELEEYIPDFSKDVQFYLQCVQAEKDHLASASGIATLAFLTEQPEFECSMDTLNRRMRKARNISFGDPKENSDGMYGSCQYVWCVKEYDRPNHYRYLTEEEEALFDKLLGDYYASSADRVKKEALLMDTFQNTEMSKEEFFLKREELKLHNFSHLIVLFKAHTGLQIVRATEHDIRISAF